MAIGATDGIYTTREVYFFAGNDDYNHGLYSGHAIGTIGNAQAADAAYGSNTAWDGAIIRGHQGFAVTSTAISHEMSFFTDATNTHGRRVGCGSRNWLSTPPVRTLEVYEAGDGKYPVRFNTGNNEPLEFYNDSASWHMYSECVLYLGTNGNNRRMTIQNDGTVSMAANGQTQPNKKFLYIHDDRGAQNTATIGDAGGMLLLNRLDTIGERLEIGFSSYTGQVYGSASIGIVHASTGSNETDALFFATKLGVASTDRPIERMRILHGGNVGIGTITPGYALEVAGTFYSSGSSIDYKQDVKSYSPPAGALMSLNPVQYEYRKSFKKFGKRYANGVGDKQIGFLVEDIVDTIPEIAITKTEDGQEVARNVDYEKLTVLLVSEVQKLRTELDEIKKLN